MTDGIDGQIKMSEDAERVLDQILNRDYAESSTIWQEIFDTHGNEKDTISRGLDALAAYITEDQKCVLHGWIDQAVLEIVARGSVSTIRPRAHNYRADQGGDTGVLVLDGGNVIVLEFSFEGGEAALRKYKLAHAGTRSNAADAPRDQDHSCD